MAKLIRRALLEGDLGRLQMFGVDQTKLNAIERAINTHQRVELNETDDPKKIIILIEGNEFVRIEKFP
jgi:nitrate reductase NapAB chaperone NapD